MLSYYPTFVRVSTRSVLLDIGIVLLRKLLERELRALADGRPLKQWTYRPDMVPIYPSA